ncbi:MAG: MFS transporter [Pseudonocardiaceae bacterium]|nr:MAG: MFS transporter [Pseudonocardiaceae bacterium]
MSETREPAHEPGSGPLASEPRDGGVAVATVAARMDRLPVTRTHRRATLAVGLGLFFEFYEVFLTGVLTSVLTTEFHLTKAQLPPVLASTFIGMFLGALILGRLADRVGRRGAFLLNLGVYSLFSFLGAFSMNAVWLMVTRFLAGIGLGAEPPLADTYLTDLLPPRFRGRYIAWAYTLAFCGVPVVGFLAKGITEGEFLGIPGWRWMFVIGAIGALVVFLLRRGLPESPRWRESAGRQEEAEAVVAEFEREARAEGHSLDEPAPVAPVAAPTAVATDAPRQSRSARSAIGDLFVAPYRRRTTMMVIFHVFQTIGYYGFGTMVPLVLVAKGYPVSTSLLFTALTYLGYPLGSALSLPLVERFERKFLVIGSLVVMAVLGLAFGFAGSMALILVFGFLYTAVSNVFSNAYHIYQAEIFPTQLRSTASSGTYALSRLATAAMPFVLVPLLNNAGVAPMFAVVVAAVVIVAINVAVLGPRTTGRTLEAVNSPAGGH